MSNYSNRPFFYNLLAAFRPYAAQKAVSANVSAPTSVTTSSHTFSTSTQSGAQTASPQLNSSTTPSTPHSQIAQAATARAIASKTSSSNQAQGFAQAAAAFSPPSHHHAKHAGASPSARRAPTAAYSAQGFASSRNRRGSDSSGDEGFVQRPGADKWFVGGKMGNGEERFYKLSMVRRERSNDRKSCDRMSL